MPIPSNKPLHTPRGFARFTHFITPDQYDANAAPSFNTGLVLDPSEPEVQTFLDTLRAIYALALSALQADLQEAITNAKNGAEVKKNQKALDDLKTPEFIKDVLDRESGEPTGKVYINFKTYAFTKDGTQKKVRTFDGKGKPFDLESEPWSGSVMRVNFTPVCKYIAGALHLTCWINGVQILKLVSGGAGASAGDMFGGDSSEFQAEESFDDGVDVVTGDESTGADY